MLVYLIILFIIIFLGMIFNGKFEDKKIRKIYIFIICGIMFIVMGFRHESIGTDTILYNHLFTKYSYLSFSDLLLDGNASIGYAIYNKLVSILSNGENIITITNSFIICLLFGNVLYKNPKHIISASLLFMSFYHFFTAMNISRQYIAVMLILNAYLYFKEGKKGKYFLFTALAITFHSTAVVTLIIAPFLYMKNNKKNIIIYSLTIAGIALLFDPILNLFANVFPHYSLYLSEEYLSDVGQNRKIIITIIYIVFSFIIYKFSNSEKLTEKEKEELRFYFIINNLAILTGLLSLNLLLMSRIEIYFAIYAILYIPKVINYFKESPFLIIIFNIIMFIPMLIQLLGNIGGVYPYLFR